MTSKLDNALNFHQTALNVRAARQELLSSNIANGDTPNYKARDIDFSSVLSDALSSNTNKTGLTTTSPMHLASKSENSIVSQALYRVPQQPSADGNTVEMDAERAKFADNSIKYDASLTFISGQIRNLMTAIQER
jgi:flagellar basal-body rod protein FlgB